MTRAGLTMTVCAALLWAGAALAAVTPQQKCEQAKLRAQGILQQCLAKSAADVVIGKNSLSDACWSKFSAALDKADTIAAKTGAACRYLDNGDGAMTDLNTGLVWEQKTGVIGTPNTSDVHDVNNTYTWSTGYPWLPTGTAYTDFLYTLNGATSSDGSSSYGCFTNHCDWRLPTVEELHGLVDYTQGVCGGGSGACIDPALGPTQEGKSVIDEQLVGQYWSASTVTNNPSFAWPRMFWGGGNVAAQKDSSLYVRAVRGGL